MTIKDILRCRLQQQQILKPEFNKPEDVVKRLVAVQSQDYLNSLWAVGLRMKNSTEEGVERALARKTIVRTWPMRGTLHFISGQDIHWMLKLLTPRIVAANASRLKKEYEVDEKVISRSKKIIVKALQGGHQRSRDALYQTLESAKIPAKGQRGLHILWRLSQDGVLCFGTREGKQHTFTLLDEWIPATRKFLRDEALAELALRYFSSHGPALLSDFTWWSGLSSTDAKAGFEMIKSKLIQEKFDDKIYIMPADITVPGKHVMTTTILLPNFDEYTVGYTDRSTLFNFGKKVEHGNGIFKPIVMVNGQMVGTWKRTFKKKTIDLIVKVFSTSGKTQKEAIESSAERYAKFLGRDISSLKIGR